MPKPTGPGRAQGSGIRRVSVSGTTCLDEVVLTNKCNA